MERSSPSKFKWKECSFNYWKGLKTTVSARLTPSILALRRQRQAYVSEFQADLVYRASSMVPKVPREKPVSKNQINNYCKGHKIQCHPKSSWNWKHSQNLQIFCTWLSLQLPRSTNYRHYSLLKVDISIHKNFPTIHYSTKEHIGLVHSVLDFCNQGRRW